MKPKTRIITAGALLIALGGGLAIFLSGRAHPFPPLSGIFSGKSGSSISSPGDHAGRNGKTSQRAAGDPRPGSPEFEDILQRYMAGDRSHEELVKNDIDRNMAQCPLDLSGGVTGIGKSYWRISDSEAAEIRDIIAGVRQTLLAQVKENLTETEPDHARRTFRYQADAAFSDALRETLHAKLGQIGSSEFATIGANQFSNTDSLFELGRRDFTISLDPEPLPPLQSGPGMIVVATAPPLHPTTPPRVEIRFSSPDNDFLSDLPEEVRRRYFSGISSSDPAYLSQLGLDISDP